MNWRIFIVGNTDEEGQSYKSALIGLNAMNANFYLIELDGTELYRKELTNGTPHLAPGNGPFDYFCSLANFLYYGWETGEVTCDKPLPELILPETNMAYLAIFDSEKRDIDIWMKCAFQHVKRDEKLGMASGQGLNPFVYQKE